MAKKSQVCFPFAALAKKHPEDTFPLYKKITSILYILPVDCPRLRRMPVKQLTERIGTDTLRFLCSWNQPPAPQRESRGLRFLPFQEGNYFRFFFRYRIAPPAAAISTPVIISALTTGLPCSSVTTGLVTDS